MNDNLEQLTDSELSEVFAVEVVGLEYCKKFMTWFDNKNKVQCQPIFATDANAVLPFLLGPATTSVQVWRRVTD
jgi:hypothetical protein